MRRYGAGNYATLDGRYRVVKNWGDTAGWTVLRIEDFDRTEVLDTWRTLSEARLQVEQCEQDDQEILDWLTADEAQ